MDGLWGVWGAWGPCSKTCGVAEKTRIRICDNPAKAHGGESCDGSNQDINTCKDKDCPGKKIGVCKLIYAQRFRHQKYSKIIMKSNNAFKLI